VQKNFLIYPNPAQESIIVKTQDDETFIELFNVLGEKVYSTKVSSNNFLIDISEFKNGLYTAVFSSKLNYDVVKLMIAH